MSPISIKITTGETEADTTIKYIGENVEIISDEERETFKIGDWDLKKAVEIHAGAWPDDVFVRSPTPWNDVYHRYNWDQVQRTLRPIRSRVLGIHTKPVIVSTRVFENHSHVTAQCNADISHMVEDSVSKTWSTGGKLTVGQEFEYEVKFGVGNVAERASLSFTGSCGNETSETKTTTLKTTTGVEVLLEPNQAVVATLTATHGTLELEIDYQATLSGSVFANYSGKFEGHHFWAYPINKVLKAAGLPEYVNSMEKISVDYYAAANVEIRDKEEAK